MDVDKLSWAETVNVHTHIAGAPRGVFQQPAHSKCIIQWLSGSARPLPAVHNDC